MAPLMITPVVEAFAGTLIARCREISNSLKDKDSIVQPPHRYQLSCRQRLTLWHVLAASKAEPDQYPRHTKTSMNLLEKRISSICAN